MENSVTEAAVLDGQKVAFTGKLATMARADAIRLVRELGGAWSQTVGRETTMLVIGQEGWPLQANGRLSRKLQRAKSLASSQPLAILGERAFFERVGVDPPSGQLRNFSTARLGQLLNIPGHRIRQWIAWGLVSPSETIVGLPQFDFRQVAWAKTLCDLLERGVPITKVRRSVEQLRCWLPEAETSLAQLSVLEKDGRLLVRVKEELVEPSGQRTLDFPDDEHAPLTVPLTSAQSASEWFSIGYTKECSEDYAEAEEAYRKALCIGGPDAEISFNLANVLYAMGKKVRAVERYWQVVELDPSNADAWNNLGNVLEELCAKDEALSAYHESLRANPFGLDALYNIADLLDQLGRHDEAITHLKTYLRQEQVGPYAEYARRRVAEVS
jgi:tetratricopeptide (TPR) repeat protein